MSSHRFILSIKDIRHERDVPSDEGSSHIPKVFSNGLRADIRLHFLHCQELILLFQINFSGFGREEPAKIGLRKGETVGEDRVGFEE